MYRACQGVEGLDGVRQASDRKSSVWKSRRRCGMLQYLPYRPSKIRIIQPEIGQNVQRTSWFAKDAYLGLKITWYSLIGQN